MVHSYQYVCHYANIFSIVLSTKVCVLVTHSITYYPATVVPPVTENISLLAILHIALFRWRIVSLERIFFFFFLLKWWQQGVYDKSPCGCKCNTFKSPTCLSFNPLLVSSFYFVVLFYLWCASGLHRHAEQTGSVLGYILGRDGAQGC